jgi:DNA damage-binding protein 1
MVRGDLPQGPLRFVDGGFIELFLDMSEATQDAVCDGLGFDVENVRDVVEELRRLH